MNHKINHIKALSIQQPWAWCILNAGKDIENRTWPTVFRGPFLIHAGKKIDYQGYMYIRSHLRVDLPPKSQLLTGGFVGIAEITDCVPWYDSKWYNDGYYGFVLSNVHPIEFIPWKGQLGLFNVPFNRDIGPDDCDRFDIFLQEGKPDGDCQGDGHWMCRHCREYDPASRDGRGNYVG